MKDKSNDSLYLKYLSYSLPRLQEVRRIYKTVLADEASDVGEMDIALKRLTVIEFSIAVFEEYGVDDDECSAGDILEVILEMPLHRIIHIDDMGAALFNDLMDRVDKSNRFIMKHVNGFASWLERKTHLE